MKRRILFTLLVCVISIFTVIPACSVGHEKPVEPTHEPPVVGELVVEYVSPPPVYYLISEVDRAVVERVVMAEAGGEPFEGQKAVAQCILETARATGQTPGEAALEPGQYATPSKPEEVTESVRAAVVAVFDDGALVTDEPIRYFYNPARCESRWHESLTFVIEIGGHRFFKE